MPCIFIAAQRLLEHPLYQERVRPSQTSPFASSAPLFHFRLVRARRGTPWEVLWEGKRLLREQISGQYMREDLQRSTIKWPFHFTSHRRGHSPRPKVEIASNSFDMAYHRAGTYSSGLSKYFGLRSRFCLSICNSRHLHAGEKIYWRMPTKSISTCKQGFRYVQEKRTDADSYLSTFSDRNCHISLHSVRIGDLEYRVFKSFSHQHIGRRWYTLGKSMGEPRQMFKDIRNIRRASRRAPATLFNLE